MSTSTSSRRRHLQHPQGQPASGLPTWALILAGVFVAGTVAAGGLVLTQMVTGQDDVAGSIVEPLAALPETSAPGPTGTVIARRSPRPSDLVARARLIKPLEDIRKGDRVLYQGHVCTWQLWNKDINTSTIKCPGQPAFQIQTGRLTPVELRTGASKLVVEHT